MALIFPSSPAIGDKFSVGGNYYTWNGTSWYISSDVNFSELKDVNVATVTDTQTVRYDAVTGKWTNAASGIIPDAFDVAPFGLNPTIYENITLAKQDNTVGVPTVDYTYRQIGASTGFNHNVGTFDGLPLLGIGYNATAGNGIAVKIPAGIKAFFYRVFMKPNTPRYGIYNFYWNGLLQANYIYRSDFFSDTASLSDLGFSQISPYGFWSRVYSINAHVWRLVALPDANGGILYISDSDPNTQGHLITGMAFGTNDYNITQSNGLEMHWNSHSSRIPTTPAAVTISFDGRYAYDMGGRVATNSAPRRGIPYIANGSDKMIAIVQYTDGSWDGSMPAGGYQVNRVTVPAYNCRPANDWFTNGLFMKMGNPTTVRIMNIRVPYNRITTNPIGGTEATRFFELTWNHVGSIDNWIGIHRVYTYDIPTDPNNAF